MIGFFCGFLIKTAKKMETTLVYWDTHWDNGKENGNYYKTLNGVAVEIMEKKMETTIKP